MKTHQTANGSRVQVTNYSPFRGLRGTIQHVHTIEDDAEDPFCFYLVALDSLREPIWFEHTEIEFLDRLPIPVQRSESTLSSMIEKAQ
jgi:hypothetical protein